MFAPEQSNEATPVGEVTEGKRELRDSQLVRGERLVTTVAIWKLTRRTAFRAFAVLDRVGRLRHEQRDVVERLCADPSRLARRVVQDEPKKTFFSFVSLSFLSDYRLSPLIDEYHFARGGNLPSGPFPRTRHVGQFLFGHLAFSPDVPLGAHGDDRGQAHECVLGGMDAPRGMEILDEEDLERRFRHVDPQAVRRAHERGRRDVDRV